MTEKSEKAFQSSRWWVKSEYREEKRETKERIEKFYSRERQKREKRVKEGYTAPPPVFPSTQNHLKKLQPQNYDTNKTPWVSPLTRETNTSHSFISYIPNKT